jgi:hypothetical protein
MISQHRERIGDAVPLSGQICRYGTGVSALLGNPEARSGGKSRHRYLFVFSTLAGILRIRQKYDEAQQDYRKASRRMRSSALFSDRVLS